MQFIDAVKKLRDHEADLKKMGVKNLYMFGSTVTGKQKPDSDVDLFFDCERTEIGLIEIVQIQKKTSEILGCKADIMTRDSISKPYRKYIVPNAIPVF